VVALMALSCAPGTIGDGGGTGQIRLALSLLDGTSVGSVTWQVRSAANVVVASGTFGTGGSRAPTLIASLTPATHETVTMTATTSVGAACAGTSPPFDVVAGASVTVDVAIRCEGIASEPGLGTIVVTGTIVPGDQCPTLTSWLIAPQRAASPDPIDVTVTAADADAGDTLAFNWTASSGSFLNPAAAATQYVCGTLGSQTLHVEVTDDHAPLPCATRITFPDVDCL
jgi:hypothetical protein